MAAIGDAGPRVLTLRALGLGDLLTGVPALRALADAFPCHRKLLACPRILEPLVWLTDAVDEIVDSTPLAPLDQRLRGVDVAVNLHGRGPQSHRLLQALEPGRLIAFANPDVGIHDGPRWEPDEHEVIRWCRLLSENGIPADPSRLDLRRPDAAVPDRVRGATVIHPGAASAARRWPLERFAAVAHSELARGHEVVITGSDCERQLACELAESVGIDTSLVLAGRTDLRELAAVVAAADTVLCGDTGVAHLATAMGTPSVVLFGPVSPEHWGPPRGRTRHRVIWNGGLGDPHGSVPDPGLLKIEVDEVLAELDAVSGVRP